MKSQERQQFWQQHVDAWQASDLSGAAFCKQHDLNYAQFNYWRRKFQPVDAAAKSAGFAQVTQLATSASSADGLGVHLPSGTVSVKLVVRYSKRLASSSLALQSSLLAG